MNYIKIYDDLCSRGKTHRHLEYKETHHILPRCLGGQDNIENLTTLSSREHYLAHWLLCKIHPQNWKISHAFFWMSSENGKNARRITAPQYERAKKEMAKNCSIRMREDNPMHRPAAKEKISIGMRGDNNPMRKYPERNHVRNGGLTPSMGGSKWFTDGKNSRYFKHTDVIPDGWVPGMASYEDRGKWITNGKENRKLKEGDDMPNGFEYGKTHKQKR